MRFHSRVITRDAVLNGPSCRTVTVHRCRSDRPRDASHRYRYFMPHVISFHKSGDARSVLCRLSTC